VVRQLQRFRRYPAAARSRKEEGTVLLSFSVDRAGHVLSRTIARSSGHADLNEEVIAVIARAEPLPPFPATMPQQQIDLTLPMRFTLR
jgi:protein TonB